MPELFRLGGWGMYPTAVVGVALVVATIHAALYPERNGGLLIVRKLGALTALVSLLGFVTGVVKSLIAVGGCLGCDATTYALIGVGESLVVVALGLLMLAVATAVSVPGLATAWSVRAEHRAGRPARTTDPYNAR